MIEVLYDRLRRACELLRLYVDGSDEVLVELRSLVESTKQMLRGWSCELTWVKNKVGSKYYYYYLKNRELGRSIYVGPHPAVKEAIKFFRKSLPPISRIHASRLLRERVPPLLEGYRALIEAKLHRRRGAGE